MSVENCLWTTNSDLRCQAHTQGPAFPDLSIATRSSWQYLWQQITAAGVMSALVPMSAISAHEWHLDGVWMSPGSWVRTIFSWISSPSQWEAIKPVHLPIRSQLMSWTQSRPNYIAMSQRILGPKPWASVHIYQKVSGVTFHWLISLICGNFCQGYWVLTMLASGRVMMVTESVELTLRVT